MAIDTVETVDTTESATAEAVSDTTDATSVEATTADAGATEAAEVATDGDAEVSAEAGADAPAAYDDRPARPVSNSQPELSDALTSAGGEQDGPRKEVEGGRAYEIIYIARIGDDARNADIVERVRALVDDKGGAVDNVRSTETRRLSYPIDGENDGIYYVINARFTPDHMGEVDRFFKLEEDVIRHMILREDV